MAAIPFMRPFPSWQFRANLFHVLWFVGRATSQQETAKQSLGWSLGLRRQIETGWSVRRCVSRDNHFAPLVHTHSFMHHEQPLLGSRRYARLPHPPYSPLASFAVIGHRGVSHAHLWP